MQTAGFRAGARVAFTALPSLLCLSSAVAFAQTPPPPTAPPMQAPPAAPSTPAPAPAPVPAATPAASAPSPTPPASLWTATPNAAPSTATTAPGASVSGTATVAAPTTGEPAAAGPTVAAPAPQDAEADEKRVWAERDRAIDEGSTITGGSGLLHLQHAEGLAPGQFALGFTTEFLSSNFLCTSNFPCARPGGGAAITNDTLNHFGADLTLTAGLTKWLEAYVGTSAVANSDSANRPSLLQVLGDSDLGIKAYGKLGNFLHLGAGAELWLLNGTGSVGVDGAATSAKFRGLATVDLRDVPEKPLPLRFSFNIAYVLDNGGNVVTDVEAARTAAAGTSTQITRIERFGLGINRVDHLDMGIGGELFLADERIRPFAEYNILVPVNRQNYACNQKNISGDNCLADDQIAPSKLTIGSRFLPWKHGFSLLAALDVGITGQNDFIEELAPIAPWTLYIGAGWAVDTWDRPPVVQKVVVEKPVNVAPPEGHIKGYVHEVGKPEAGVPSAIVAFANHADVTSLATGPDGHFATLGLPPGQYDFRVSADGYKDGTCSGTLNLTPQNEMPPMATEHEAAPPPGGTVVDAIVDCALEALPRVGKIVGHVRTAEKAAVPNVQIKLTDSAGHEFTAAADGNGVFRFEGMAPGAYHLEANAPDYMTDIEQVEVKARQETPADVVMMKSPNLVRSARRRSSSSSNPVRVRLGDHLPESDAAAHPRDCRRVPQEHAVSTRWRSRGTPTARGSDEHNRDVERGTARTREVSWLVASRRARGDRLDAKGYGEKNRSPRTSPPRTARRTGACSSSSSIRTSRPRRRPRRRSRDRARRDARGARLARTAPCSSTTGVLRHPYMFERARYRTNRAASMP